MAKKKNKNKNKNKQVNSELPPKYLWKQLDNKFVESYTNGRIMYTKDFYVAMHKKIQEGMTYVEAYKSLGFNIDITGTDRANAAGKRAEQMARTGKLDTTKVETYNGSIKLEDMPPLSDKERLAYLEARVIYLERLEKVKKKLQQDLLENSFTLK